VQRLKEALDYIKNVKKRDPSKELWWPPQFLIRRRRHMLHWILKKLGGSWTRQHRRPSKANPRATGQGLSVFFAAPACCSASPAQASNDHEVQGWSTSLLLHLLGPALDQF